MTDRWVRLVLGTRREKHKWTSRYRKRRKPRRSRSRHTQKQGSPWSRKCSTASLCSSGTAGEVRLLIANVTADRHLRLKDETRVLLTSTDSQQRSGTCAVCAGSFKLGTLQWVRSLPSDTHGPSDGHPRLLWRRIGSLGSSPRTCDHSEQLVSPNSRRRLRACLICFAYCTGATARNSW
jgi:hypothetical protein